MAEAFSRPPVTVIPGFDARSGDAGLVVKKGTATGSCPSTLVVS